MSQLRDEILQWAGSWSASFPSRSLQTFEAELAHYPPASVTKALKKARQDWEHVSPPTLKFVLDRLPEASSPRLVPSTIDFWPSRGIVLEGPVWANLADPNCKATLERWASGLAAFGNWSDLAHPSVVETFAKYGAELPVRPQPRQGVFA